VGAGLGEVVTHALVAPRSLEQLAWPDDGDLPQGEVRSGGPLITVRNPLSAQHSVLRQHVVPSLLDVLATNERHGRDRVPLFEIGKGYARGEDGPREWWRVAFLLSGAAEPASWVRPERPYDLDDAKAIVELLAEHLSLDGPVFAPDRRGIPFHPGRAASVTARVADTGGPVAPGFDRRPGALAISGHIAELHPDIAAAWDLRSARILVGELAVAGVGGGVPAAPMARTLSRVPAVERDLAVVVRDEIEAGSVAAIARGAAGDLLRHLRLFDVYRGAPLGPDEKSLAIRLVLQSADRTLTDAEVDAVVDRVAGVLAAELGARLRS
jgi:phenylalanyl-tRNA synthetase beta chain